MNRQQRDDERGPCDDPARGGFTCMPNKLLEALALARFTASETRCLLFLLRKTYGWHKQEETISLAEWALGTGVDPKQRHNVLRTLRGLLAKQVIYAKANGNNRPLTWGLNNNMEEWDKALFSEGHASMSGVAGLTSDNTAVLKGDNNTELMGDNTSVLKDEHTLVITDENTSVLTNENTTVITDENTPVLTDDNTTVITGEFALYKRKIKERSKEKSASHPALQENARTPQQVFFGVICEALGWDTQTITEGDKLRVAQAVKILIQADYSVDDIRRFMVEVWFRDWRWQKHQQRPTLSQLRQEIGKVRLPLDEFVGTAGGVARTTAGAAADGAVQAHAYRHGREEANGDPYAFVSAMEAGSAHSTAIRAELARKHGMEYDVELQRQFDEHRARRKAEGSLYYQ